MADLDRIQRKWINLVTRYCLHPSVVDALVSFTLTASTDPEEAEDFVVSTNESLDANLSDKEIFLVAKILCLRPAAVDGVYLVSEEAEEGMTWMDTQTVHMGLHSAFRACVLQMMTDVTEKDWIHLLLDNETELYDAPVLTEMRPVLRTNGTVSRYVPQVTAKYAVDAELLIEYMRFHKLTPGAVVRDANDEDQEFDEVLLATVTRSKHDGA